MSSNLDSEHLKNLHAQFVKELSQYGITNTEVLKAVAAIPREQFVSKNYLAESYADMASPIECGQTISQPSLVALMTQTLLAGNERAKRVLEIGTGSGYQAAILSCLVPEVYSIERIQFLHDQAKQRLADLQIKNVHLLFGDGNDGWLEHAPYDGIIVTAAAPKVPQTLLEQLAMNGRMVIPLGDKHQGQRLEVITRKEDRYEHEFIEHVVFVPLLPGVEK